jgi:putative flippase GtrA
MVLGLFLRRVPVAAPYASITAGFGVSLSIYLAPLVSAAQPWGFPSQMGAVVAVSAITFLLVRAFRRPDAAMEERETEFFSRRNRPVDFVAEIGVANDGRQLRIVGVFGAAIGLAILLLLIPASSAGHAAEIIAIALSTLGVGSLMIWSGRKMRLGNE